MIARILVYIATAVLLVAGTVAQSMPNSPVPSDDEIRKILIERIDTFHQGVGIVVGVVDAHGRRIITYGKLENGDPCPLNGDTISEIGSVTKVFTSLLLADMVQRGEVALADPVAKYLPPEVKMPERGGRQITLVVLSTHTSGLPRGPSNFHTKDPTNPYADYTVEQLYQFLSTYQLTRDIGSQVEYSNLGAGLLGLALARRAGMDYEALVHSRITGPLGMTSTGITLTPEMKARMAVGHNAQVKSVPNWDDSPAVAGAGGGGRRRIAVERQRHAHFSQGQPWLREVAAGPRDGFDAVGPPPANRYSWAGSGRLGLAHRQAFKRPGDRLPHRRHRRV
jgi:serine-type D-Ala-D-Ala carboxypeptidase/endopeptidase